MKNEWENICVVIKMKQGMGLASALGCLVRKGLSEDVTLGDTQLLPPEKWRGVCVWF